MNYVVTCNDGYVSERMNRIQAERYKFVLSQLGNVNLRVKAVVKDTGRL